MTRILFTTIMLLLLMASCSWASSRWSLGEDQSLIIHSISNNSSSSTNSALQKNLKTTTVTCESTYGFLPCTTEVWGQLFLIIVYEYLLSLAQHYVSSGSDLFFKMFGSKILGASVFQILGSIPQVSILLITGITGSTETAEGLTAMGLSIIAGSTVMSLTLIWGAIVAFGSYDLSKPQSMPTTNSDASTPLIPDNSTSSTANSFSLTEPLIPDNSTSSTTHSDASTPLKPDNSTSSTATSFSLTGYGVTTDTATTWTARIMLASMIPFLILQLPQILDSSSATRVVILITIIISISFFLAYCTYQVFRPWIQDRRLEYILLEFVRNNLLDNLLDPFGRPDEFKIQKLFEDIDKNNNGNISKAELQALFFKIQLKEVGFDASDYVAKMMEQFDISDDGFINQSEFIKGMKKWLQQASQSGSNSLEQQHSKKRTSNSSTQKSWLNYMKAFYLVILGITMATLLVTPLLEGIQEFATAINIPSFIISYIVVPLAMGFKPAIAAIKSSKQKTQNAISLTLSATYGGVFMNGMLSLTMFLLIFYIRDITWNVSAGMLVVLLVGSVMGFLTSFNTKFPFWISIFAFLLYPISIGLIYVLITYFGWS